MCIRDRATFNILLKYWIYLLVALGKACSENCEYIVVQIHLSLRFLWNKLQLILMVWYNKNKGLSLSLYKNKCIHLFLNIYIKDTLFNYNELSPMKVLPVFFLYKETFDGMSVIRIFHHFSRTLIISRISEKCTIVFKIIKEKRQ